MQREVITPKSEQDWLDLRKKDLTSTMMPALFGLSPYSTVFELYHAKKNKVFLPFETNERMEKGKRMEGYAAQEVAIREGWDVRPKDSYIRLKGKRIGSSFDFEVSCPKKGLGILEIKALDFFRHKEYWSEDEIPADKEIQIRHQMMVSGEYSWGVVCAFTSVYDYHPYFFERDMDFESGLLEAAEKFWSDVDNGREPRPDFYRDAPVIAELYKGAGGELVDRTKDQALDSAILKYEISKEQEARAKADKEAAKAQIHRMLENDGGAYTENFRVKAGWTKGSPGKEITGEMVGEVIYAKNPHRRCDVARLKNETSA